ncbi:Cyclic nucleotide-binding-like [Phytophthora cactorum]|nr:Cyclic nucleotide-binding-like [Phytophthora cactorum]
MASIPIGASRINLINIGPVVNMDIECRSRTTRSSPLQAFRKPRAQEPHRHVPLTRARCDPVTHEAGPMQVEYYSQRAGAGLIITEAVAISVQGFGWYGAPCLYTEAHRDSWKPVVEAVHAKGAKIFLQIWHIGRQGHPSFSGDVVGPSAIGPVSGHTRDFNAEKAPYELCRELKTEEISEVINDFCKSARLAKEAGFDGVDIHAANGYLPDTFLQSSTNKRTDKYGGSIENRARFLLELVEALQNEWLADRIGLRLSPNGFYGDTGSADNYEMCCYVAEKLSKYGLAYLATLDGFGFGFQDKGPLTKPFDVKKNFKGTVMAANSYTRDTAEGVLLSGAADLVSFGRPSFRTPTWLSVSSTTGLSTSLPGTKRGSVRACLGLAATSTSPLTALTSKTERWCSSSNRKNSVNYADTCKNLSTKMMHCYKSGCPSRHYFLHFVIMSELPELPRSLELQVHCAGSHHIALLTVMRSLFKPEVPPHLLKLLQKTPEEQERVAAARAILMDEPALRNEQSLDLVYSWMLQNCKQYSNNIFGAAPEYIRREICRQMRLMKVKSGGLVIRQGDTGDRCYIVVDGLVDVYVKIEKPGEVVVTPASPPPMLSTMKQRRTSRRLSSEVNSAPVDFGAMVANLGPGAMFGEIVLLNPQQSAMLPLKLLKRADYIRLVRTASMEASHYNNAEVLDRMFLFRDWVKLGEPTSSK